MLQPKLEINNGRTTASAVHLSYFYYTINKRIPVLVLTLTEDKYCYKKCLNTTSSTGCFAWF